MNMASTLVANILIVLPYALALGAFYLFLRIVYHVKAPVRPLFLWPIILALTGTAIFMFWGHYHIAITATAKYGGHAGTFSPFYAITVALAGYVVAWVLFYIFRFLLEKLRMMSKRYK
ncbi:MAG: hypothetical protein WCD79_11200 [Chthoniobacteraceae bacterium]